MSKPWIVMTVLLTLIVGVSAGVAGTLVFDDDGGTGSDAPAVGCDEARAVVDTASGRIAEINESEARDPGYYAALIVEQRAAVFAMDAAPSCFDLQARADAVGLLEGLHSLLEALAAAPATGAAPADAGAAPTGSSDTGE